MRKVFLPLAAGLCIAMMPQVSSAAPSASLAGVQAGSSVVEQVYYRRHYGGYYPRYRYYGYYPRYRYYPYYDYGYYPRPYNYYRPYVYRPYPNYYRRYWY